MYIDEIFAYGRKIKIACDGKCINAWGINSRPKVIIDENNQDDYYFLADNELKAAPIDPGTYEGSHTKPICKEDIFNKWCFRECERSKKFELHEEIKLDDFSKRIYNIPRH